MDSSNSDSSAPSLQDLSRRSLTDVLLPWVLGMVSATSSRPRELAVIVDRPSFTVTVIEGSLLRDLPWKEGPSPASKASIEALPLVSVTDPGLECAICLAEYEVDGGVKVKEMPCRHRFHGDCIDKWLGIHGSCPICRYSMPVEEEEKEKEEEGHGSDEREVEERERGRWNVHLFLVADRSVRGSGSGPDLAVEPGRVEDPNAGGNRDDASDDGNDELTAQEMDMDNID